jgi:hypothetical protein
MLGTKIRAFAPLPNLSLEELVPKDNFYRRLEEKLDLSFVRESVSDCYAPVGRPSVDPVVFFKLQLVLLFERLRSERQLNMVKSGCFVLSLKRRTPCSTQRVPSKSRGADQRYSTCHTNPTCSRAGHNRYPSDAKRASNR